MRQHLGLAGVLLGAAASFVSACSDDFSNCEALRNCAGGASGVGGSSGTAGSGQAGDGGDSLPGGGSLANAGAAGDGQGAAAHAGESGQGGRDGGVGGAGESGSGGSESAGGGGGEAGSPESPPPECGATPEVGCVPSATGSVYVNAAAAPSGDGSQAAPFQTITAALAVVAKGQASRVLVCSAVYPERVSLTQAHQGVWLLGGFNCSDWHYDPLSAAEVAPGALGYALELQKVSGAIISDLRFTARAATAPGGSSIAAFVNESTDVKLARVSLRAGAAQNGVAGALEPIANWPMAAQLAGTDGKGQSSSAAIHVGGEAKQVTCPEGNTSKGGNGGSRPSDQFAAAGEPAARGGAAGDAPADSAACDMIDASASFKCICVQTAAANGKAGPAGANGASAPEAGVLAASGFLPHQGGDGGVGLPGGGGGGGDGAWHTGYTNSGDAWYGGGGGGVGGCGGNGATGGTGGGASIALAMRSSTVSAVGSSFISGNAGKGGAGVAGQVGQPGGAGGVPVGATFSQPCVGGKGGAGGNGGAGGGGAGGVSLGIAYAGPEPIVDAASTYQLGQAGSAGPGGAATNAGAAGVAKATLQVTAE